MEQSSADIYFRKIKVINYIVFNLKKHSAYTQPWYSYK